VKATGSGFRVWLSDIGTSKTIHRSEDSGYLVLEKGAGPEYLVETFDLAGSDQNKVVSLTNSILGENPSVFAMIQSANNEANPSQSTSSLASGGTINGYVRVRTIYSSATDVKFLLETDNRAPNSAQTEKVGYLAFNSGCTVSAEGAPTCAEKVGSLSVGGAKYDYVLGRAKSAAAGQATTVNFGKTFVNIPTTLINIESTENGLPCEARLPDLWESGLSIAIESETNDRLPAFYFRYLAIGHFAEDA